MINLPIYRAKKLDSDKYIIGQYIETEFSNEEYCDIEEQETIIKHCIIKDFRTVHDDYEYCNFDITEIDIATLAIHFPDMIDSQKNKIFASLQEDGKGGDIIETELKRVCTAKYKEYFFYADNKDYHCNCFGFIHSKIIGIQQ